MKREINTIASALLATVFLTTGCNDTSAALQERANQERTELRAEVEGLKADLKEAKEKVDRQTTELKNELKDARDQAQNSAKNGVDNVTDGIVAGADKVDKAVAGAIREEPK